ncbi:MAG: cytochrome c oxidase assembly protein [Actinobacteria bacterium]|nr:cytochrome c oxidase assembly protein [Actinomycetota bacterium]
MACLFAGLVVLLSVLATPFAHLAGERLWAHMVQHVAIVAVAAPLLVMGRPMSILVAGLPPRARQRLTSALPRLSQSHIRHYGAWSGLALVAHTAALWIWHVPGPYEAALRSEPLHVIEHLTLLATALLFWSVVVGSRHRALYGGGVLVTFAAALQGTALGVLMTLATTPWYPSYARAGALPGSGLTAIEDQQLAGVVMWGPCSLIYALAAVLLFAAWIRPPQRVSGLWS